LALPFESSLSCHPVSGEFAAGLDRVIVKLAAADARAADDFARPKSISLMPVWVNTIGGMMVFPGNRIDGKQTINGARGFNRKIADRFDLTLECIRRHYLVQHSPLSETLARYRNFFALFEDFKGYIEFFMLQDLVTEDCSAVRFFMPFDDFNIPSVPRDGDTYKEYRRLSIEFIEARNRRIGWHAALRGDVAHKGRIICLP
jgi:hypothetical protein